MCAVRVGVGLNALALLFFAAVPPVLGMVARSLYPALRPIKTWRCQRC